MKRVIMLVPADAGPAGHGPLSSRFYVGAGLQRDCFLTDLSGETDLDLLFVPVMR